MEYAGAEKANVTTQNSLVKFAENFSAIQDYRHTEIKRLEAKVVRPLATYGDVCKHMKSIVKSSTASHNKELKQKQQLQKLREKAPGDRHQIAESELQRASKDAVHYSQALEGEMAKFEKEKIVDLKTVLADFVSVEMAFHARALEFYAKCAENVASIDEHVDLEEFRTKLMATGGFTRQQLGDSLLSSTGGGYNNTLGDTNRSMGSTLSEDRRQIRNYNSNMYGEIEDDDDDDDDVESEEDDYNRARLRK